MLMEFKRPSLTDNVDLSVLSNYLNFSSTEIRRLMDQSQPGTKRHRQPWSPPSSVSSPAPASPPPVDSAGSVDFYMARLGKRPRLEQRSVPAGHHPATGIMASGSLTQSQLKFNFPKPRRPLKPLDFKNALQSTSASAPSPQDTWPASGFLPSITEKVNYVHSRWVCQFCSRKYRARAELGRHMPRCPRLPPFDLSKAADLQAIVPVDRDSGVSFCVCMARRVDQKSGRPLPTRISRSRRGRSPSPLRTVSPVSEGNALSSSDSEDSPTPALAKEVEDTHASTTRPMIQCDRCFVWLHMSCVAIDEERIPDVYGCPRCTLHRSKAPLVLPRRTSGYGTPPERMGGRGAGGANGSQQLRPNLPIHPGIPASRNNGGSGGRRGSNQPLRPRLLHGRKKQPPLSPASAQLEQLLADVPDLDDASAPGRRPMGGGSNLARRPSAASSKPPRGGRGGVSLAKRPGGGLPSVRKTHHHHHGPQPMSEPNWAHGHIPPANMFTNSAANHLTAGPHLQPRPSYQPAPGAHMQPYSDALSHSHRKRPLARRGSSPQTPALALLSGLGSDSGEVHPDLLYSEDSTMLDSLMQGTIDHNPHLLYPSLGVSSDGLLNIHAMMDHPPPALSHLGTLPGSLPPSHWSTTGAGAGATPDTHILSSQFMLPPDQSDQLLHSALDNLDASEADFLLGNILSEADLDFYQRTLGPELGSDTGGRTPSASQTTTGYPPASVAPLAPTGASFESLEVDHHPIRLGLDLDDNQSTYPVDLPPSTSTARRGSTASSVAATPTLPARANLLPPTAVAASKTKAKKSASVASSRPKALPRTTVKPKTNPRGTPSPLMTVRPIATTPTTPSTTPAVDGHQVARTTTPGPTGLSNDFTQPLMYPPTTATTANTLPNPLNFNAYNLALQNASFFNYFDPAGNYGPSAGMSFPGSAYAAPHGGNLNGTAPNGGAQMDLAMLQAFYNSTVPTSTSATAGYPTGSMATGMGPADANHLAMALSFPNNMGTGIVAASSSSANDQYNQYQYHHHQHQHSTLPNMPSVSTAAFASNNSAAFSTSTSSATAAMSYFSGYPGTVTSVGSNGLPFGTLTTMGAGSHPNPMNQSGMEGGIPSNGPDLDGLLDINAFIQ
ncbi:hypothetical protein H4R33_002194 [Dimargaris cristalligena]|nr:hypothetical protein H4R33_002194 [Dimargaris cristalligena]